MEVNMKKIYITIFVSICTLMSFAQESKSKMLFYSLFVNYAPEGVDFPLVGFINTSTGTHRSIQIGFVNTNIGDFTGAQIGFVNTNTNNLSGLQIGFVNTNTKSTKGGQIGFINTTAEQIKGTQIGFMNYAKSVSGGIPIGFLSIVKEGGYRALELSVNELYPVNLAFKIGVPQFYTFFAGHYNPNISERPLGLGFGAGTLVPMAKRLIFNPECESISSFNRSTTYTLALNFRYEILPRLQIALAPSLVWSNGKDRYKPFYALVNHSFNEQNRLIAGLRFGISWNLTE
jgi:hypothetical protein